MKKFLLILTTIFCLTSCDQVITRNFGGTTTIKLEPGEKLIETTWKGDDIWYLVEPMEDDYIPKKKIFRESSVAGVMEGQIIFIETK